MAKGLFAKVLGGGSSHALLGLINGVLKSLFIPERGKRLFQKEDIMKIKNVSSVWGYLPFFTMVMAMVLVLSGSIVFAQKLIDLNGASQKELESIKGVDPAAAEKIVAGRPYKSIEELKKAGLSAEQIDSLKPFVTVGAAAPAPAPAPTAALSQIEKDRLIALTAKGYANLNPAEKKEFDDLTAKAKKQ
jgi:hypothetical protein